MLVLSPSMHPLMSGEADTNNNQAAANGGGQMEQAKPAIMPGTVEGYLDRQIDN